VIETHEHAGDFKEFRSYSNRETVRVRLYYLEGVASLSVEAILAAGGPPQKQKKGRSERQVKKPFLVAFVVSGLALVPVQRSDAQIFIGIPGILGIGTGPGANYGYPHFEYGYYPYGGYYYQQPDYGYYGGPAYDSHPGHRAYSRHHRYHLHKASLGPISTI
jgi:hypothetical protein